VDNIQGAPIKTVVHRRDISVFNSWHIKEIKILQ